MACPACCLAPAPEGKITAHNTYIISSKGSKFEGLLLRGQAFCVQKQQDKSGDALEDTSGCLFTVGDYYG